MKIEQIKSRLMALSEWQSLTAYEMTKRVCAELTNEGEKIPAWTAIRDIIGKGSSNDINRAKEDFRTEHGNSLRKMSGFVEGVPAELSPHIQGFWHAAVAFVKAELSEVEIECREAVTSALERAQHAEHLQLQAEQASAVLSAQIKGLQQANDALQQSLHTETATREQAERLLQSAKAEQVQQREELRSALAHSQTQLDEAISRLEGVENHALRQVQDARDEAKKKVDAAEGKLKAQTSDHVIELARSNRQLIAAQQQLSESSKALALLEQDNSNWRDRAARAEKALDLQLAQKDSKQSRQPSLRSRVAQQDLSRTPTSKRRDT